MKKVIIVGAGGRDFHNFNVAFRGNEDYEVVAFTASQIPGIDDRVYPPALAGRLYPHGIRVAPEEKLTELIHETHADEVVFAYSDVSHEDVMHKASIALAAGADFRLMGPKSTMIQSSKPVVSVCAVRTGCGKSQTSRRIGQILLDAGLRVALVRHPMPYHDLETIGVQRFASLEDIDASNPTVEEREEYERPVAMGMVVYAGVDYRAILERAQKEADVVIWDGGNNDFSFFSPDLSIVVADPLRPGHALHYHPGEANLRMADVVVVNKIDSASTEQLNMTLREVEELAPLAALVMAESPVAIDDGPSLHGKRVLVVDDGPTITHGGMPYGAGLVAAWQIGAVPIDPRPYAVGSIRATLQKFPHIMEVLPGSIRATLQKFPHIMEVLPAMGYGNEQLRELEATIEAADCDAVIAGTPFELNRVIESRHPVRHVTYTLRETGKTKLADALEPVIVAARQAQRPQRYVATTLVPR